MVYKYKFESFELIDLIIRKIKPLFIIIFSAAVISSIVALTITPKYKSSVILFPASSSSISQALFRDNLSSKDILRFGDEEEVEQILQILHSYEIRDRIIEKYDLINHYEISPNSAYPMTKLYNEFKNNISFKRTEFMSIEIEVLDVDPEMAADIANNIAALVDSTMNRMTKERARKALTIVEKEYINLELQINELKDSLTILRGHGVINYEAQSEVFSDALAQAIVEGNIKGAQKLEEKLKILAKYGGDYVTMRDKLYFLTKKWENVKAKQVEAKVDAEQDLPHKFIVNNAIVAEKKSYPVRWLIVVISTISTTVLALLLLIFFENIELIKE